MPNFDGGHYFLTVLAPVRTDFIQDKIPGRSRSHRAQLAQKLALIPTGKQTAASPDNAWPSPFTRNTLNHLARFVIIDGPAFNGRNSGDSLVAAIQGIDPLVPQPVDRFDRPYLLFAADIDAQYGDGDAALRAYTDALWATMQDDLTVIFGHCAGFDGITTADAFHTYIRRCQVETTMPFNDYWAHDELKAKPSTTKSKSSKSTSLFDVGKWFVGTIGAWLVTLILDGLLKYFRVSGRPQRILHWITSRLGIAILVVLALLVVLIFFAYRFFMRAGRKPFPTAPGSDLPSVLKSLFIQQHFTHLAIEAQGLDAAALHARFGVFLKATQPADPQRPTQAPGEFHAPALEAPQ